MRAGRWTPAVPAALSIAAPAAPAQSGGTVPVQLLAFGDLNAFEACFRARSPVPPRPRDRIARAG